MGFKHFETLHSIAINFRLLVSIQSLWKKSLKRWADGYFLGEGWEKGNFSNWQVVTGWNPYRAWLSDITLEGNIR
ncbi:hypothetical protein SAMN05421862_11583 [Pseudomonas extremaustralis]|nr:hypothetical protein SAMN05421862_11583 [Pseudomonas extremaustralis]